MKKSSVLFALVLLALLFAQKSDANISFKQYQCVQQWQFERIDPTSAYLVLEDFLTCRDYPYVPLVLGFDISLEAKIFEINGQTPSQEISDTRLKLFVDRYSLAEVPLARVTFDGNQLNSILNQFTPDQESQHDLKIILRFLLPEDRSESDQTTSSDEKSPFARAAEGLCLNGDDSNRWLVPSSHYQANSQVLGTGMMLDELGPAVLRVKTKEAGIVKFTKTELENFGLVLSPQDIEDVIVVNNGIVHPSFVINSATEPYLLFHCVPDPSNMVDYTVFYLGTTKKTAVPGKLVQTSQISDESRVVEWYPQSLRFEENHPHLFDLDMETGQVNVFWKDLFADKDPLTLCFDLPELTHSLDFPFTQTIPKVFPLVFNLKTSGEGIPPDSLEVFFNGQKLSSFRLKDNNSPDRLAFNIPTELMRPNSNTIHLMPIYKGIDARISARLAYLDSIEIWYPRKTRLNQPMIETVPMPSSNRTRHVSLVEKWHDSPKFFCLVEHFSGDNLETTLVQSGESGLLTYSSPQSWTQRILFDPESLPGTHSEIELINPSENGRLLKAPEGSTTIILTIPEYFDVLHKYLADHPNRDRIKIVDTQDVYDRFSFGYPSPEALRAYLQTIYENTYPSPPQYLWLVGESSWDKANQLQSKVENQVPSKDLKTTSGFSNTDYYYACMDDDELPDLMVSRVSVSTTQELHNYLEKARSVRQGISHGWWRNTGLFLVDRGFLDDVRDIFYEKQHRPFHLKQILVDDYPLDIMRSLEAHGQTGYEARGIRNDVIDAWNQGAGLVEYVGHGGVTVWSHYSLFKGLNRPDSDVLDLQNVDQYPVVLIRSCLSASSNWPLFPGEVSVAEALIKAKDSGAIGVIGSAGTEYAQHQRFYGKHFHRTFWGGKAKTLGEVKLHTDMAYLMEQAAPSRLVGQIMSHGDPTLPHSVPQQIMINSATMTDCSQSYQTLLTIDSRGLVPDAETMVRVYHGPEFVWEAETFHHEGESGFLEFVLPKSILSDNIDAKIYQYDNNIGMDYFGQVAVTKQSEKVAPSPYAQAYLNLGIDPAQPIVGQEIVVSATIINDSTTPISIKNTKITVLSEHEEEIQPVLNIKSQQRLNRSVLPGTMAVLSWHWPAKNSIQSGKIRVSIESGNKVLEATGTFSVSHPPELWVSEIIQEDLRALNLITSSLPMVVKIKNIGGFTSDPCQLDLKQLGGDTTINMSVPPIQVNEEITLPFAVSDAQAHYHWKTGFTGLPNLKTHRNRWHLQSLQTQVDLAKTIGDSKIAERYSNLDDFKYLNTSQLHPTEKGLVLFPMREQSRIPISEFIVLRAEEIYSTTHALAAAHQHRQGWFLSSDELQANPNWLAPSITMRCPWEGRPQLMQVSPIISRSGYYHDTPAPGFVLEHPEFLFRVSADESHSLSRIPSRIGTIAEPGIDWDIRSVGNTWTSFGGAVLEPVPEIVLPVYYPEKDLQISQFEVNFVSGHPSVEGKQVRWISPDGNWTGWFNFDDHIAQKQDRPFQLRYWFEPEIELDTVIGSIDVKLDPVGKK